MSKKSSTEPAKQVRQFFFEALQEKDNKPKFNEIFNFNIEDYRKVKKLKEIQGKEKKIIIHTGSGWKIKHWDNNKWAELIKRINEIGNFKFIFIGGDKQEEETFKIIQDSLDFKIYSLIKEINIKDLMLVMKLSDYFIGVDSGPRNMAHIANLRSISLLGPGVKIFMPIDKRDIVIDKSNCRCTNSFCLKKETCMDKIEVDEVYKGFKKILKKH